MRNFIFLCVNLTFCHICPYYYFISKRKRTGKEQYASVSAFLQWSYHMGLETFWHLMQNTVSDFAILYYSLHIINLKSHKSATLKPSPWVSYFRTAEVRQEPQVHLKHRLQQGGLNACLTNAQEYWIPEVAFWLSVSHVLGLAVFLGQWWITSIVFVTPGNSKWVWLRGKLGGRPLERHSLPQQRHSGSSQTCCVCLLCRQRVGYLMTSRNN